MTTPGSSGRDMGGLPSWATRGRKVVCIKVGTGGFGHEVRPALNGVYTIREIVTREGADCNFGLRFAEIRNKPDNYFEGFMEFVFRGDRFRPVVPQKTEAEDTAYFRQFLTSEELA